MPSRLILCAAVIAPLFLLATRAAEPAGPFHTAAMSGDLAALDRAFVAQPADVDRPDPTGVTPLMLAALEGHVEVVQRLLERGANAAFGRSPDQTPLHYAAMAAAAAKRSSTGFSDVLLNDLYQAALAGKKTTIVTADAAPTPATPPPGAPAPLALETFGNTIASLFPPLPADLRQRKARIIELLLAAGASAKSSATVPAFTPLHWAALAGGDELALPLLRAGANPNARVPTALNTPLHNAITAGSAATLRALVAAGADPELLTADQPAASGSKPGSGGLTPLMLATMFGQIELVQILLDGGAKPETSSRVFARALHLAAQMPQPDIARLLLDRGARHSVRDRWQTTPLNYAASRGRLATVRLLVERGADLETADEARYTPLLDAIEKGHPEVVKFLVARGASLAARTDVGKGPLHVAVTTKNLELARYLLDECGQKANGEPADRLRPLHDAVGSGTPRLTALLLERGADPNALYNFGYAPLHLAVTSRAASSAAWRRDHGLPASNAGTTYGAMITADDADYDEIIRLLVARGANLELLSQRGESPLHLAAKYGSIAAVNALLAAGASPSLPTRAGRTPLELATAAGHAAVVQLLGGSPELVASAPRTSARQRLSESLRQKIATLPPVTDPAAAGLAPAFLQSGIEKMLSDPATALRDFERALTLDPQFANAYNYRGLMRLSSGDRTGALADFTRAIELKPGESRFYLHRATTRGNLNDYDGALADMERAVALDPTYAENYLLRGKARAGKNDRTGALADFTRALELEPNSPRALSARAHTRGDARDRDGAIADFTRLIALQPNQPDPLVGRADQYRAKRELDPAIADYDAALRLASDLVPALLGRAYAHDAKQDYTRSFADYSEAIRLNPKLAAAWHGRGHSREARNDFTGALADFDRAVQLDPKSAEFLNCRGSARNTHGDFDAAVADFNQALALNPRWSAPFHNRGLARRHQGDYPAAIADFDAALKLSPNYAIAFNNRAITRQIQGDFAAAVADYDRHLAATPNASYPRLYRFLCQRRLGQSPPADDLAAAAEAKAGSWTKSLADFLTGKLAADELVRLSAQGAGRLADTRPCEAHYAVGVIELVAGRTAEARGHFEKAIAKDLPSLSSFHFARAELARLNARP